MCLKSLPTAPAIKGLAKAKGQQVAAAAAHVHAVSGPEPHSPETL